MSTPSIASRIDDTETSRLRTLIVGGGVAGLTLAALLRQRGEAPVIIEREPELANTGYMLGLYPIGSRVLHGLDLYDRYRAESVTMRHYRIGNRKGEIVRSYSLQKVTQRFGPIQGIRRGTLIELLRTRSEDLPIYFETTVTALEQQSEEVKVTFSDGSSSRFDVVVAADGLHSDLRSMVLAEGEYAYRDTGWGGWVFWANPERAPLDTYTEYWGAGRFLGLYPVKDRLGIFLGGPVDTVKEKGFEPFAKEVADGFQPEAPGVAALRDRPDDSFFWNFHDCRSRQWHQGRVVLLGDAAVGFLPTAGVGASMAMESAAALSDVLSRTSAERVEQGLALYEERHRRRVERAQTSSRQMGRMMFLESSLLARARNAMLSFYTVDQLVQSIADIMEEPV